MNAAAHCSAVKPDGGSTLSTDNTANADVYVKIADLAREMSEHLPADATTALEELVGNAVDHIPGATYAGITVVARGGTEVTTPAATAEHPRTLDALQQKHREGPCFAAATEHDTYVIRDLHTDQRWPLFQSDAVIQTPIRSIASFTLYNTRDTVGALNLYADEPDAFDHQARDLGYVFAAHAAVVWSSLNAVNNSKVRWPAATSSARPKA